MTSLPAPHPFTLADAARLLRPRPAESHKGTFGTAMLIAGQHGMAGAAVLAAKACLRSGAGKVIVHTPQLNNDILQISVPEAVLHHATTAQGHFSAALTEPPPFDALAIGPGLGTHPETRRAVQLQAKSSTAPLLIDADGLRCFSAADATLSLLPPLTILTPHAKEFDALTGLPHKAGEREEAARKMAQEYSLIVVLKRHATLTCLHDGTAFVNTTGNSGMATAGSGDVLSGIITALLAQGYEPGEAAPLGVFIHGLAGDLAATARTEHGLIASDIIAYLPEAFKAISARGQQL